MVIDRECCSSTGKYGGHQTNLKRLDQKSNSLGGCLCDFAEGLASLLQLLGVSRISGLASLPLLLLLQGRKPGLSQAA